MRMSKQVLTTRRRTVCYHVGAWMKLRRVQGGKPPHRQYVTATALVVMKPRARLLLLLLRRRWRLKRTALKCPPWSATLRSLAILRMGDRFARAQGFKAADVGGAGRRDVVRVRIGAQWLGPNPELLADGGFGRAEHRL